MRCTGYGREVKKGMESDGAVGRDGDDDERSSGE